MLSQIKKFYVASTGHSYTNMGRLFLRLFVGIMLMQFGVHQLTHYFDLRETFPNLIGLGSEPTLIILICIEVICSLFIMVGFMTRIMTIPPFIAMLCAEIYLVLHKATVVNEVIDWNEYSFLPVMFMGIYFFIILVGPGKISVDYFLSLHFLHSSNHSETELEEV